MKIFSLLVLGVFFWTFSYGQIENYETVEYKIIAEGNDSPFDNFQVVCFNKYFNLEQLPASFQNKYALSDKQLFKQKMLVQIFYSDKDGNGIDKIEIEEIVENSSEIIVKYSHVNADTKNDSSVQSPFIVVQIPKAKKEIKFVADGNELGKGSDLYIKN